MIFKYERLPNFCYGCGLLNHAIKDCPEGWAEKSLLEDSNMQYGAWLRGEPWRMDGIQPKVDRGKGLLHVQRTTDTGDKSEGGHVQLPSNMKHNISLGESSKSKEQRAEGDGLHEFGIVNGVLGKCEERVAQISENVSGLQGPQATKGAEMQWEASKTPKGKPRFELSRRQLLPLLSLS